MKKFKGPYELSNQRMVYFNTVTQNYYDPTLDIEIPADKVNAIGFSDETPTADLSEDNLQEVAPPSKEAEEWIKSNKDNFKKQYGKKWEPILYAAAWKRFGKNESTITEHKNTDYINPWKEKGFDITVSNYDDPDYPNSIAFEVKKDELDITIIEPQDGEYYIFGHKDKYNSFDEALNGYINQTLPDSHLKEEIDRMAKMSGSKNAMIEQICNSTNINEDLMDLVLKTEARKIKKDVYEIGKIAGKSNKKGHRDTNLKEYLNTLDFTTIREYKDIIETMYNKGIQDSEK